MLDGAWLILFLSVLRIEGNRNSDNLIRIQTAQWFRLIPQISLHYGQSNEKRLYALFAVTQMKAL